MYISLALVDVTIPIVACPARGLCLRCRTQQIDDPLGERREGGLIRPVTRFPEIAAPGGVWGVRRYDIAILAADVESRSQLARTVAYRSFGRCCEVVVGPVTSRESGDSSWKLSVTRQQRTEAVLASVVRVYVEHGERRC
jgi:hypothetical protein